MNQQVFLRNFTVFSVTPLNNDQEIPSATTFINADPAIAGPSYQLEVSFFQGAIDHQVKVTYETSAGNIDARPTEFGGCEFWLVPRRQRNL